MIGITFPDLLRFFIQASVAVAGAASLWGFVLSFISLKLKNKNEEKSKSFYHLSSILMFLFGIFFIAFLILWWFGFLFVFTPLSLAHEGIKIDPTPDFIRMGFVFNLAFVWFLTICGAFRLIAWKYFNQKFRTWAPFLFFIQFLIISAILCFSVFTGSIFTREQTFFSFHNWHSILTLGSVIVVDVLYLATLRKDNLKRVLYKFFPWISAFIWIGLGLDFFSVILVFEEAFKISPQFLFSQTVVAIIILNGLLLSERLNKILIGLIRPEGVLSLSPKLLRAASISGAVSITSWTAITFVDFFELTASYTTLLILYFIIIIFVYLSEPFVAKKFPLFIEKVSPDY